MISVQCPSCKKMHSSPVSLLGKKVRCNNCQHVFVVTHDAGLVVLSAGPVIASPAPQMTPPPLPVSPRSAETAGTAEQHGDEGARMRSTLADVYHQHFPGTTPLLPPIPPPSTSTRVCEWCAESISEKALKCPHCAKWRKDIAEDRKNFFTNLAASILLLVLDGFFFLVVWQSSSTSFLPRFPEFSEVWHERVVTKSDSTEIMGIRMPGTYQTYQTTYEFSVGKFLSSWEGWFVIVLAIAGVRGSVLARRYRISLERKTGARWRL